MPKLSWRHECYVCQSPLDIIIRPDTDEQHGVLYKYRHIRPLFLLNNVSQIKLFGLKARRVCRCCFVSPPKVSIIKLMERETGIIKNLYTPNATKTKEEIVNWFNDYYRIARRYRADDM